MAAEHSTLPWDASRPDVLFSLHLVFGGLHMCQHVDKLQGYFTETVGRTDGWRRNSMTFTRNSPAITFESRPLANPAATRSLLGRQLMKFLLPLTVVDKAILSVSWDESTHTPAGITTSLILSNMAEKKGGGGFGQHNTEVNFCYKPLK